MRTFKTLSELPPLVGQELAVSDWITITQEQVNQFADATGDHQWIHVDVERAKKETPFGSTIAHGFLTLSLMVELMGKTVQVKIPAKMGINYGLNKVRFVSVVPAGSNIRARITLVNLEEIPGGHQMTWGVTIEREGSDKPACVAEWLTRTYA